MKDNTSVRIYYYYDFTDTDHFCSRLEQHFRETGHERPLEFISWNCYRQQPGMDGWLKWIPYMISCISSCCRKRTECSDIRSLSTKNFTGKAMNSWNH
jgi:hypothetical protein